MILTQTQQTSDAQPTAQPVPEENVSVTSLSSHSMSTWLPNRAIHHDIKAGLNPIADAASCLLSAISKMKTMSDCHSLAKLKEELVSEMDTFYYAINQHGYHPEYTIICRYIMCSTVDDIATHTKWGGKGQWEDYSLLAAYDQDTKHEETFFTILERTTQDPARYIDLMELIYLCLSMGYKGPFRSTEHSQFQLEQITHHLYQHIRAYRGNFSKALSPKPLRITKPTIRAAKRSHLSLLFGFLVTACLVMAIFVSLGYFTDMITNEAFKPIAELQNQPLDQIQSV